MKRKRTYGPKKFKKSKKFSSKGTYKTQTFIPRPLITSNGMLVDLPYASTAVISTFISTEAVRQFRGASIFDPDLTGVGHQPLGHDQWAGLYSRYRVVRSTFSFKFTGADRSGSAVNSSQVVVLAATEGSSVLSVQDYIEQPHSKHTILACSGNDSKGLSMTVKPSIFEGDIGAKYDKDYTADFGANPTRDFYYTIGARNVQGDAEVNVAGIVYIVYRVLLYDRIDLTVS